MATRYSGDLKINVSYHDRNDPPFYRASVSKDGKVIWRGKVRPAPSGFGPGVGHDSARAFDEIAKAALGFAANDGASIEDSADHDDRSFTVRRTAQRDSRAAHRDPQKSETRRYEYIVYPEASHRNADRAVKVPIRGRDSWDLTDAKQVAKKMGPPAAIYSVSKGSFVGYIHPNGRYVSFTRERDLEQRERAARNTRTKRDPSRAGELDYWRHRGFHDGRRGRPPLFRTPTRTRAKFEARGEGFNSETLTEHEAGRVYMAGYDAGEGG